MIDLLLLELYKNGELNFLHETLKIILYTSRDKNVVDRFYSNKKFVDFMLKHVCLCTASEYFCFIISMCLCIFVIYDI